VIFANAEESPTTMVDNGVRVAERSYGCERLRFPIYRLTIESLVWKMRKIDSLLGDRKRAATVLVHARTGIEWSWQNINRAPVRSPAHDDVTSTFGWSCFDPVHVFAIETNLAQAGRRGDDEV
jgi:hypothetical protein